jgi:hypothetical protein
MATAAAIILKFILSILHHLPATWISGLLRQVKQPQTFAPSDACTAQDARCANAINAVSDYAQFIRARTILIQLRFREACWPDASCAFSPHRVHHAAA